MVAGEQRRGEGVVEALDHGERVTVVAPDEARGRWQSGGGEVATVAVGILDQNVGGAGGERTPARGRHLGVHLGAERCVPGLALARLVASGDAGNAFDVGADEHLHDRRR